MRNLPPELVDQILSYLKDREYWICQETSTFFKVSSGKVWRERKYINTDFYQILYEGDLEGVRYHLETDSQLIADEKLDRIVYSHIYKVAEKTQLVCALTAVMGHVHILQELIRMDYPIDDMLAVYATKGHQLDFLKYLHFMEYQGKGISYHLAFYQDLPGMSWYNAVTDGTKFDGINLNDFYDYRVKNYMQKKYRGKIYRW